MPEALSWSPGWFPDPTGRHDHRWWDGAAWTAHVADAGVASLDALATPTEPMPAPRASADAASGNDPVAVTSLALALGSILLAFVPGFGLVLPVAAIALAVIARARIRTSRRAGDGIAIAGLVLGIGSLLLAIVVSAFTAFLLLGSGGELAGAFAEYVACLEVRTPAECQVLLEESLARITG